ncbi:radical SAM family heme chaperone HemW [Roseospirillum parvum]|uniref:Heme chaperone HemW n=1 Tax=Roseospirillum parvum TaxID=83401 RepID=A0A1G8DQC7_9PROT|nr:radical SAM family heme chaperone HemW [Roseospirillum parvum]SDH59751.1 oxygen-independent coproporphyrinogen-3 oxidase [Roseospirillum parvum]
MPGGFGLYLHWPFCRAKCPYCDFNSHPLGPAAPDPDQWARAYVAEMNRAAALTGGRTLGSIFLGGGTPSLMPPALVGRLLDHAARLWPLADDCEITLEANPGTVDTANLKGFAASGINRLSLGLQALDDAALKALGRIHDSAQGIAAARQAAHLFPRLSLDLMIARPGQTAATLADELDRLFALIADTGAEHISLYQLTLEPGTALHAANPALPDDADQLYIQTVARCRDAGLPLYEISNFARPGAASRHNLLYWQGGDWLGLGPGAHGRLTLEDQRHALGQHRDPATWLATALEEGATTDHTILSRQEDSEERLMMGLRLAQGLPLAALPDPAIIDPQAKQSLVAEGLLADTPNHLQTTDQGRLLLDHVLPRLLR